MNHETGAGQNPDQNSDTNSFGETWGKMDQQPYMYGRIANIGFEIYIEILSINIMIIIIYSNKKIC